MSCALDDWTPPRTGKPEYYDTVKFIYKYIEFHISEDEAYTILNAFIEKWDASAGEEIKEKELVKHVTDSLQHNFDVVMARSKIERIVHLILAYLHETGHFYQHDAKGK